MAIHWPVVGLREDDVVTFDGERYDILGRVADRPSDTFVVEHDGVETERHMDWFAEQAENSDRVVIDRNVDEDVRRVDLDRRAAFLTWDALERSICWAVDADEMDVAAEYVDTLMLQAAQADEWHEEYMADSELFALQDPEIRAQQNEVVEAIRTVGEWARDNDHAVREWFEA